MAAASLRMDGTVRLVRGIRHECIVAVCSERAADSPDSHKEPGTFFIVPIATIGRIIGVIGTLVGIPVTSLDIAIVGHTDDLAGIVE